MLSFDLSVIDIVLVIAVIVLTLLFLTQRRGQPTTTSEMPIKSEEEPLEKPKKPKASLENKREKLSTTSASTDSQKCAHHFGYLKNLPKNTPVPDECFGCPKVVQCLFHGG